MHALSSWRGSRLERAADILGRYRSLVDQELREHLPRRGEPRAFYDSVWELLDRGGKRFRPALTLLSCEAVGGRAREAIPAAAAVELLHNMTLVHDDIEDASELRRGRPCLHVIYGVPTAINSGDAMLIKVFDIATHGDLPSDTKLRLVQQIADRAYTITRGQALEFDLRSRPRFTEQDVIRILENKTGALVALATEAGAIVGGASKGEYAALSRLGQSIGVGFQIIDDVLNVAGDVRKYGKEIGGDIREGKRTIMAAHVLKAASQKDKRRFIDLLGKSPISQREIHKAIKIYEKYGSIEYARKRARAFLEVGLTHLSKLRRSEARKNLARVARFLLEREF